MTLIRTYPWVQVQPKVPTGYLHRTLTRRVRDGSLSVLFLESIHQHHPPPWVDPGICLRHQKNQKVLNLYSEYLLLRISTNQYKISQIHQKTLVVTCIFPLICLISLNFHLTHSNKFVKPNKNFSDFADASQIHQQNPIFVHKHS